MIQMTTPFNPGDDPKYANDTKPYTHVKIVRTIDEQDSSVTIVVAFGWLAMGVFTQSSYRLQSHEFSGDDYATYQGTDTSGHNNQGASDKATRYACLAGLYPGTVV